MDKAEVLNHIRKSFHKDTDLISWMNTPIKEKFEERSWTQGQFLCKALYDEFKNFGFYARQHYDELEGSDKKLSDLLRKIQVEFNPLKEWQTRFYQKDSHYTDVFQNREKNAFYENLMVGDWCKECKDNSCYLPNAGKFVLLFIETRLKEQFGMTDNQVKTFFIELNNQRRLAEAQAKENMPLQLYHSSKVKPEELNTFYTDKKKIIPMARMDDNFHTLANFIFCAPKGSFYSSLVSQDIDSAFWKRFKPTVSAVNASPQDFFKSAKASYLYHLDMSDKNAFYPCIPLWGGEVREWVAVKPLTFIKVEREDICDILQQGMKVWCVPNKKDFQKLVYEGKVGNKELEDLSPGEVNNYFEKLSKEYPEKVIKLEQKKIYSNNLIQVLKNYQTKKSVPINPTKNEGR